MSHHAAEPIKTKWLIRILTGLTLKHHIFTMFQFMCPV